MLITPQSITDVMKEAEEKRLGSAPAKDPIAPKTEDKTAVVADAVIPAEEQEEFLLIVDEDKADVAPVSTSVFDRKKWKELDDDIDTENFDEEKVLERAKQYKDNYSKAQMLVESKGVVDNDQYIQSWGKALKFQDEDLVLAREISKYTDLGLDSEAANERATAKLQSWKDKNPDRITEEAEDIRLALNSNIKQRSEQLSEQLNSTRKALSLSTAPKPEFLNKAKEELAKQRDFLGLKFGGKTESSVKDFLKTIEAKISDGSILKRIQEDPSLLAEVAVFVENKEGFKKAIANRMLTDKTKALNALDKAPHVRGKALADVAPLQTEKQPAVLKDPKNFK